MRWSPLSSNYSGFGINGASGATWSNLHRSIRRLLVEPAEKVLILSREMGDFCEDCERLFRELREVFVEVQESQDGKLKEAASAVCRLIGGSEEDIERAEQVVPPLRATDLSDLKPTRAGRAVLAIFAHRSLTGHKVF
jgi:hypothetical protein